ncbi:MAG: spermidine synthase, partial [Cyclobacteriaceae bacterium]|nr:spermidine synthase [Cyclobacteriaceae bacterium]
MKLHSNILKLALFATGLSGIVAEYVLSTLATYFLGDSVFQWTMIVSIMLFSMGLGSRISKYFSQNLLQKFIIIEFILSSLTAYVSVITYSASAYYGSSYLIIYSLCIIIGLLIGMEIPIVIRLNDEFETLHVNVSSVMENDYYGSLVGGVFFAFIG